MASTASDSLSALPDEILHQILHSLNLKQRAIASLVSTSWRNIIASLDDCKFVIIDTYCRPSYRKSYRVIKHAAVDINTTLTEFYLLFHRVAVFNLSPSIFESRLLTVLHLKRCDIREEYVVEIKELPLLKEIYFDHCSIYPLTFSMFIDKCPSIVELTLIYCRDLYSIVLPDLNELKKVHVRGATIETIEIKARNLLEFHLTSNPVLEVHNFDLCACTKLQVLKIDIGVIPIGFPPEIFTAFPCLKSLFLCLRQRLNKINLLSHELENLTLSGMVNLDDVFIVTPNLRFLKLIHTHKKLPSSFSVVGSRLKEVEIEFMCAFTISSLFQCLRSFAENLGENITLSMATDATESKEVGFHSGNLQPLCIKHINLVIFLKGLPRYESLIDELLSYYHPQTLLVRVISSETRIKDFTEVLLDELKSREKKCTKFRKCSNYMCWRHFLEGFKILEPTKREWAYQISLEFQW